MNWKRGISQEMLKLIACVTMLMDHVGAVFFPGELEWRLVGRMAFPIYCFLMAEGMARTSNVKKYGLRLAIGAVLAEMPFDLLFFGKPTLAHQSVMVTLLLGYGMVLLMEKFPKFQLFVLFAAGLAAELLATDYGALGIYRIWMFVMTKEMPRRNLLQTVLLAAGTILAGGMDAEFIPDLQIAPLTWGIGAYCVFLLIPTALHLKEAITWHILRSKI